MSGGNPPEVIRSGRECDQCRDPIAGFRIAPALVPDPEKPQNQILVIAVYCTKTPPTVKKEINGQVLDVPNPDHNPFDTEICARLERRDFCGIDDLRKLMDEVWRLASRRAKRLWETGELEAIESRRDRDQRRDPNAGFRIAPALVPNPKKPQNQILVIAVYCTRTPPTINGHNPLDTEICARLEHRDFCGIDCLLNLVDEVWKLASRRAKRLWETGEKDWR